MELILIYLPVLIHIEYFTILDKKYGYIVF